MILQHPFDNLSREELLTLAKQQQAELEQLRSFALSPTLDLDEPGSIAEAAMQLSGVFQASQRAADIYLRSMESMKAKRESEYFLRLAEAEQQAQQLLLETQEHCRTTVSRAKESADFYWAEMHRRLDQLFGADPDLVRLLCQLPNAAPSPEDGFGPDD